jgi:EAL domain-containing protein (putative c-di-GMP-specific phosphodiesterase class I)
MVFAGMGQMAGSALSQERLLLEYIERLSRNLEGQRVVQIHLSRLRPYNKRMQHVRLASAAFDAMVSVFEGQSFLLDNSDIIWVGKCPNPTELDAAVMKVRYLFSEDPLTHGTEEDDIARFCTWYVLAYQYDDVVDLVKQMMRDADRRRRAPPPRAGSSAAAAGETKALDPKLLIRVKADFEKFNLARLLHRQPIAVILPNLPKPDVVFHEIYVSIGDLRMAIAPNVDILADVWLFQYLTQALDTRLLALLTGSDDPALTTSFSINLNVSTVLSPAFVNFDASLKHVARGTVVVELREIDIFGDIASYMFARDFLHERGYRVCLDGLSHRTIGFIEREKLGIDLMKLMWNPTLVDDLSQRNHAELQDAINRAGRARIIVSRAESAEAVRFGQQLGITMFQGFYVDKLVASR